MNFKRSLSPDDLVLMEHNESTRIDLAYARDDNLLFGEQIYKSDAQLWLHKDLARVVELAAQRCFERNRIRFVLYDGLRTIEAQEAMMQTQRVRDNPHWLEEPRMLSPAGSGGHPRGMAIDIGLEDMDGQLLDMGCPFDCMDERAHRNYKHSETVQYHRGILDNAMLEAAQSAGVELVLLAEEWWDFRFPKAVYNMFSPLSDQELPKKMRQIS